MRWRPFQFFALVAGATERLRLVTSVLVLPYRNPLLTAKMTAWLDATAVPASLRMLLPMKQIFGKSVAAEEPMVCMTHRWRKQSGANPSLVENFPASWENTGKFIDLGL